MTACAGMTNEQIVALQGYVDDVAMRMGLGHWQIEVIEGLPPECEDAAETRATIWVADEKDMARLHVAVDIADSDPDDVRHTVVHELLHIHQAPLIHLVQDDIAEHLAPAVHSLFGSVAHRHFEQSADRLARVLAPFMPLIDWRPASRS